jgi:exonuclease SbcC
VRPRRVEIEGFSAYRDRTVVSFDDADLFAFVGPTGSGKSSVIDAITFALYGSVARYQNTGAVAPVVNAQSAEAKVRLDFEVDGAAYTAVRVVRRTKSGATTKEARLERGDEVLAGDARALDDAVVTLLGLTFEQFTKTVVLPQGEFAAFLHAKASERQDLLVRLLDLGVYGEMAGAARTRERAAAARLEVLERQLDDLGVVDPEAADAAAARAVALAQLLDALRGQLADVEAVDAELAELVADRAARFGQRKLLAKLAVPEPVKDFADERAHASGDVEMAEKALEETRLARDAAAEAVRTGPDGRRLDLYREGWVHLDALLPNLAQAEAVLAGLQADLAEAAAEAEAREAALEAARTAHEIAVVRSGAEGLRHVLVVGEPCPVCEQEVSALPAPAGGHDVREFKAAVDTAVRANNQAQRARSKLEAEVAKQEGAVGAMLRERDQLQARLADAPPKHEVEQQLARLAELHEVLEGADTAHRQAELMLRRARTALATMDETEGKLRRQFTSTRDQLATLEPPPPGERNLLDDWVALVAWADHARERVDEILDTLAAREQDLTAKRDRLRTTVAEACEALDVDGTQPHLLEAITRLIAQAEGEAERIRQAVIQSERLRADTDAARAERDVAKELGGLLGARGFEQWLLEEAVEELVAGATERLYQLSSGQFSLRRDDKGGFAVVDHRNADELRSVKTLSGGETFLASLALALALADNVALLSSQNAPKLESIFLDEGFGTLDADTLDVVANAIEELGASGRLVGIVTHIPDLADRLPVRFVVRKLGTSATIERVDR